MLTSSPGMSIIELLPQLQQMPDEAPYRRIAEVMGIA